MSKTKLIEAAAAFVIAASWCSSVLATEKPITVGFAIAQTGWMEQSDTGPARFAELAIDELNEKGGLLGRKIVTTYADTKTDIAQGAKAGLAVLDKGADLVIVSCDYDQGSPAALEANKADVIAFATCAGDPLMGVQGVGPYAFTAAQAAQTQGSALAKWAFEQNFRKAYILLDSSFEFNKSVCAGFDWRWEKYKSQGGVEIGRDSFRFTDPSIGSQITRIENLSEKPDFIVICSFPPGGATALRQIRAAGIDTPIITDSAYDGNYWLNTVPNLGKFYETVSGSVYGNDPRAIVNELCAKYQKKYGAPVISEQSLSGYLLIEMWAKAVERAGTTNSAAVVAELEKFRNEPTVLGPRTFTKDLHIERNGTWVLLEIVNGEHKSLGLISNDTEIPTDVLFRVKKN
jgi:branched-chain amino acid transport system substrate-binding protein